MKVMYKVTRIPKKYGGGWMCEKLSINRMGRETNISIPYVTKEQAISEGEKYLEAMQTHGCIVVR